LGKPPLTNKPKRIMRKSLSEQLPRPLQPVEERLLSEAALLETAKRDRSRADQVQASSLPAAVAAQEEITAAQAALQNARAKSEAALAVGREFDSMIGARIRLRAQAEAVATKRAWFVEKVLDDDLKLRSITRRGGVQVPPNLNDILWRKLMIQECDAASKDIVRELAEAKKSIAAYAAKYALTVPPEAEKTPPAEAVAT
jgi:hypothetical protein